MSATYLLSSLPSMELGAEAPFSVEEYRRRCEGIDGVNLNDFDAVAAGIAGSHKFTIDYANALCEIKNSTATLRASVWQSQPSYLKDGENIRIHERSYSGYHVDLHQKISEAIAMKNPYQREIALEKARWQIVDELAGTDYFSEAKIYAYIVKLQINNRISGLSDEKGKAAIEEFIKANDREVYK